MGKRIFDIIFSFTGLIILLPVFFVIAIIILIDSRGPVFYKQVRVGKGNADFGLLKFRTMHTGADKKGLLTIGGRDPRVTSAGYYLRKLKFDELPQLFNVLKGEMSFVGPRPEVRKYVDLYDSNQKRVLELRPGITDYASVKYFAESELLAKSEDPEKEYISKIMPEKLKINLQYLEKANLVMDMKILFTTFERMVGVERD